MDTTTAKGKKKYFTFKKFDRWLSMYGRRGKPTNVLPKSKSWNGGASRASSKDEKLKTKCQFAPGGCFSVYVGTGKQRFVIKAECANHPLFKMLLEDAELEYGYNSEGPIVLPCDVDLFYKVLAEIENGKEIHPAGCGSFLYGSCSPFRPKGYSYAILTPPRLLKMNNF